MKLKILMSIFIVMISVVCYSQESALDYFESANSHFNNKEYEDAIQLYTKVIEYEPEFIYAYLNRGTSYFNIGEYSKAIEDLNIVIQLDPEVQNAYNVRGLAFKNKKMYQKALEDFTHAIELDRKYTYAFNNRALTYYYTKEYEKSEKDFDEAIRLNPGYAYYYLLHMIVASKISQYELERSYYRLRYSTYYFTDNWEILLVHFMIGLINKNDLLFYSSVNKERQCEACFYIAFKYLMEGKNWWARFYFKKTVKTHITDFIEYQMALNELGWNS